MTQNVFRKIFKKESQKSEVREVRKVRNDANDCNDNNILLTSFLTSTGKKGLETKKPDKSNPIWPQEWFLDENKKPKCLHGQICRYSGIRLDDYLGIPILWCILEDAAVFDFYYNWGHCPLMKWQK